MKKIRDYILSHRDEIANELLELVKIPSIADTKGAKDALERMRQLFENAGAEVEVTDSYAVAKMGNGKHSVGLFSHVDVVPGGDGWTKCEPFEPKIINGDIFGRGAWDDKSAVVTSLYAFKIIKELGIDINSQLVAFVGANEETTMQDLKDYRKSHTPPSVSMVLDAGFPVYLGDKGILWLECEKYAQFEDLIELKGGEAVNITLKNAEAKVRYSCELYEELCACNSISARKEGDFILINAEGISAHGANPQGTINGAGMIVQALLASKSFSQRDKGELSFLDKALSAYDGSFLGIVSQDDLFGATTATNGIVNIENGLVKFTLDVRYGNTYTEKTLVLQIASVLEKEGVAYKIVKNGEPSAISPQNKYVQACIEAYREQTGNYEAKPRINAGSTYSRFLPNAFEIGTTMKYSGNPLPSCHGNAHQPNERIFLDGLLEALEMTVKMIIACDRAGKQKGR